MKPALAKKLFETLFHNPTLKQLKKEIKQGIVPPDLPTQDIDPKSINWQFFHSSDAREFLNYFLNMKEPLDFVELLEDLAIMFKRDKETTSFFEYYLHHYVRAKPKLFVYGRWDMYLMPFIPGNRTKIEQRYASFADGAEIMYGNFSHVMMNKPLQQLAASAVANDAILMRVVQFIQHNC